MYVYIVVYLPKFCNIYPKSVKVVKYIKYNKITIVIDYFLLKVACQCVLPPYLFLVKN